MSASGPEENKAYSKAYYAAHVEERKAYAAIHTEEKKAYDKAYRAAHPEEEKARRKAYYVAHVEEEKARKKAHYVGHVEELKPRHKAYYVVHAEERKAYSNAYYAAHAEERKAKERVYRAAHPEANRANFHNRRARKLNNGGTHTAADLRAQYERQKGKCFWGRKINPDCAVTLDKGYHRDHVVPVVKGGWNGPENLVISCISCNLKKRDKHPMDWAGILF